MDPSTTYNLMMGRNEINSDSQMTRRNYKLHIELMEMASVVLSSYYVIKFKANKNYLFLDNFISLLSHNYV